MNEWCKRLRKEGYGLDRQIRCETYIYFFIIHEHFILTLLLYFYLRVLLLKNYRKKFYALNKAKTNRMDLSPVKIIVETFR